MSPIWRNIKKCTYQYEKYTHTHTSCLVLSERKTSNESFQQPIIFQKSMNCTNGHDIRRHCLCIRLNECYNHVIIINLYRLAQNIFTREYAMFDLVLKMFCRRHNCHVMHTQPKSNTMQIHAPNYSHRFIFFYLAAMRKNSCKRNIPFNFFFCFGSNSFLLYIHFLFVHAIFLFNWDHGSICHRTWSAHRMVNSQF